MIKIDYYQNGSPKAKKIYSNGKLDCSNGSALTKYYVGLSETQPGLIKSQAWYKRGLLIRSRSYYENGSLKGEFRFDKNGQLGDDSYPADIGYHQSSSPDKPGAVKYKAWWKSGKMISLQTYKNGQISTETQYRNDKIHSSTGPAILEYYQNLDKNKPQPIRVKYWAENGITTTLEEYCPNGLIK